jgi:hypothetical protein
VLFISQLLPLIRQILQKNNGEETAGDYRLKGIEKEGLNV